MPISRDEWMKGRTGRTLDSRIEAFLLQNREKAFKLAEITTAIHGIKGSSNWGDVALNILSVVMYAQDDRDAILRLVKEGRVKESTVRDQFGNEDVFFAVN
ncbi:MAG TPA: hypothetical protein VN739_03985 [Nitrososphaerales archaeon]|nr:hypothetical protein [Nitrososphaerales archaeon]